MARVLLTGITRHHPGGGAPAVDDVSFEVADGEFLVLVGPSGCGKSTTLRIVAGLEPCTAGEIRIGDRVVNDVPPRDRDVAMIFQNYALYPHMSVYQNLAFPLKMRRMSRREIDAKVRAAAELLDLGGLLDRRPRALSGGQRQRVAVGRALVRDPAVFLFDEPLSNLDAKMRVSMRREIMALHRRIGGTSIYVTHDQVEAMTMGDRIVVMNEGRVRQIAPPREIYERPADDFVAGFIGSPPMNLIRGAMMRVGDRLEFGSSAVGFPMPSGFASCAIPSGTKMIVGIRPEELTPAREDAAGGNAPGKNAATARIEGEVETVERLGAETIVHLRAEGETVRARLDPSVEVRAGETLRLRFDPARAHFFSSATGARVEPPGENERGTTRL